MWDYISVIADGLTLGCIYFIIYVKVKTYWQKRRLKKERRRWTRFEEEEAV